MYNNNTNSSIFRMFFSILLIFFSSLVYSQYGNNDDFDGDGIINSIDVDDDNDGIKDVDEQPNACPTNPDTYFDTYNDLPTSLEGNAIYTTCKPSVDGPSSGKWGESVTPYTGTKYIGFHESEEFTVSMNLPIVSGQEYKVGFATMIASISPWFSNNPAQLSIYATNDCNATQYIGRTALRPNQAAGWLYEEFTFIPNANYSKILFVAESPQTAGGNVFVSGQSGYLVLDGFKFGPTATCNADSLNDTDGDGIPNRFDLDSDGDGCSDAKEALVSPSNQLTNVGTLQSAQFPLSTFVDTDADGYRDSSAQSTYSLYALSSTLNICKDSDGDGISDVLGIDLDDDNDGILDAIESPSCFYTALEASTIKSVKTGLANDDGVNTDLPFMRDGVTTTVNIINDNIITANQAINGAIIYNIEYNTPTRVTTLTHYGTSFGNGSTARLEGSNDNLNWASLMSGTTSVDVTSAKVFTVNQNSNFYRYYRIVKVGGTSTPAITTYEITSTSDMTGYIPSAYAKPTCSNDPDGDTVPNHQDLDSDGDGCSDAKEATVMPKTQLVTVGSIQNAQYPVSSFVDTNFDGWYDGASQTTYSLYATNAILNACLDSDGDGLGDLVDLDDDNDGILDSIELAPCYVAFPSNKSSISVTSGISWAAPLSNIVDGNNLNDNTYSSTDGTPLTGANYLTFQFPQSIILNRIELVSHPTGILTAGSQLKVQGSNNGTNWTDVSGNITTGLSTGLVSGSAASENFSFTNNTTAYSYYRLLGVSGTTINYYLREANFEVGYPIFCDADGDGISNQFDLDSDGDGCSDAKEANVTSTKGSLVAVGALSNAQYNFTSGSTTADANNDGWLDATTQTSYNLYALSKPLNVCSDFDGDGITDLVDIDDDNDGILDAIESPSCFYTAAEAAVLKTVSTPLANDDGVNVDLPFLRDGVTATVPASNNVITSAAALDVVYNLEYSAPVKLTSIVHSGTSWGASSTGRIYGSDDGLTWTSLVSTPTVATGTTNTFTVNQNSNFYRYYRLVKEAGTAASITTYEVAGTADATGYVPSRNPKPTCSNDLDGDNVPNHQDLDSDGDGCSDAKEATVTPSTQLVTVGSILNAQYPVSSFVDTNGDGLRDGATQTTYNLYALQSALNVCADTDGDGLGDLVDLDDDNDGILDSIELASCTVQLPSNKSSITVTSGIAWTGSFATVVDGINATDGPYSSNITPLTGANYLTFQFPQSIILKRIELVSHPTGILTAGSQLKVQGSNNGTTWTDVSGNITTGLSTGLVSGSAASENFGFTSNTTAYTYYRLLGVSGTTNNWYLREANFEVGSPIFCDTDGDGISNQLDLDSDGDGCSDAKEANVTSTKGSLVAVGALSNAQYNFIAGNTTSDANNDGWLDATTQTSYNLYALSKPLNVCSDFDGDGIIDLVDIDDDNDGIIDAVESPSCFYTAAEAAVLKTVSTPLANDDGVNVDLPFMRDGVTATVAASNNVITANAAVNGAVVYNLEYPAPVKLSSITQYGSGTWGTNATGRVEASNDGLTWTSFAASAATASANTFAISPSNFYRYYRIVRVAGDTTPSFTTYEVAGTADATGYVPSKNPKPTCSNDLDGDNVPNHQDLDSDGDGCSDAKEATVTPNGALVAAGGYQNAQYPVSTFQDTNGDGLYDNAAQTTYNQYATTTLLNVCLESDGDGLGDLVDLDDDNDGILDSIELAACSGQIPSNKSLITVSSGISWAGALSSIVDGNNSNDVTFASPNNTPLTGANYLTFQFPQSIILNRIELISDSTILSIGAQLKVQGSTNGTTWTDVSDVITVPAPTTGAISGLANSVNFPFLNNSTSYTYYRLAGLSGTTVYNYLREANFTTGLPIFCDTDGDGISNQLDLDSDGDGCSDAKEASVTSSNGTLATVGAYTNARYNFIAGSSVDANNDGWLDNTTETTYGLYSLNRSMNACTDSDGDGLGDIIDLDDDNDGILDCVENGLASASFLNSSLFVPNGNASGVDANTAQLTPNANTQKGQLWSVGKIDFSKSFSFSFDAYLGSNDSGADGIAVVFQNSPAGTAATGLEGAGMGASGIANGLVLELDTYDNTSTYGDIAADHGQIWDSDVQGTGLTTAVALGQLENNAYHPVVVTWDAISQTLSYTVDGITAGTLTTPNFASTYFGTNKVRFGYTASTGTFTNVHRIRINNFCNVPLELDTDNDGISNQLDLDSDNDGCTDAIEGAATITNSQLVAAGGTVTSGTGSTAGNYNLCAGASCVNSQGLPQFASLPSGYSNTTGQAIGDSQNSSVAVCTPFCIGPVIGTQPLASQTVTQNTATTALTITATGSSLTYQWYSNTTASATGGTVISGANTASYTPSSATIGTRYYYVVVSNGTCSSTSNLSSVVVGLDSDNDGLPDIIDLDDDNDGILDSVENVCTAKTEGPPIFSNDFGTDASGATSTVPDTYIDTSIYSFPNTFEPYDGTYVITTSYTRTANYTQTNLAPTYNKDAGYNDITAGSIAGRYMMINVASQASLNKAIYKVPNLAVTVGRNYRFRIDMAGLADNSADIPYLQLTVKDSSTNTVIATANSSSIGMANDDVWRRLSLEFIATSSSVTIEIVNLQPNGDYGNDLGLDNIVLRSYSCDFDADGIPNDLDLDSDNDGCTDAIEGAATITNAQVVSAGGTLSAGPGSTAGNYNLCAGASCVNSQGIPQFASLPSGYSNTTGQAIGDSQNSGVATCTPIAAACYKPGIADAGNIYPTKHGITALGRAGEDNSNWPMVRQSAWTVLEAKTKGFVINRVKFNASGVPVADDGTTLVITTPVEGMLVYDTTNHCLKMYTSADNGVTFGWYCITTQTCPD